MLIIHNLLIFRGLILKYLLQYRLYVLIFGFYPMGDKANTRILSYRKKYRISLFHEKFTENFGIVASESRKNDIVCYSLWIFENFALP